MFSHDDGLLADTVWNEYLALQKEHIQLKAQLAVAEKVCTSLQETIADLESTVVELPMPAVNFCSPAEMIILDIVIQNFLFIYKYQTPSVDSMSSSSISSSASAGSPKV